MDSLQVLDKLVFLLPSCTIPIYTPSLLLPHAHLLTCFRYVFLHPLIRILLPYPPSHEGGGVCILLLGFPLCISCNLLEAWMTCRQPAPTRHPQSWPLPAQRLLQHSLVQVSHHTMLLRRNMRESPHPLLVRRVLPLHLKLRPMAPHPRLPRQPKVGSYAALDSNHGAFV